MIDKIIAYEAGGLDEAQTIALFQQLLDTGTLYVLQGCYQRQAQALLEQGLISSPHSPKKVRRRAVKRAAKLSASDEGMRAAPGDHGSWTFFS